jgi:hypothetical protein
MTLLLGVSLIHNRSRQFTMPGDTSHKRMPFLQLTPYAFPTSSHVKPRLCHGCSGCALCAVGKRNATSPYMRQREA